MAKIWKNLFGTNDKISSNSIHTEITETTLASNDRAWHDMPTGYYYVGANGISLGYPQSYGLITHMKGAPNGILVFQTFQSSRTITIKHRRFESNQPMDWSD